MATASTVAPTPRKPELLGQTVVVIGGSSGIGLATAMRARTEGADVVITGRRPEAVQSAAVDLHAVSSAVFDANDPVALDGFFEDLEPSIDHVMVTAGGPYYAPLAEMDFDEARRALDERPMLMLRVARHAAGKLRPGGTLVFMIGTRGETGVGLGITSAVYAGISALAANLAPEIAPVRVNVIAAGFVDTPLSASLLGDDLQTRRDQLREALPIGRLVEPADVAALAVHIMANGALTGATYDIDGGQQLVPA